MLERVLAAAGVLVAANFCMSHIIPAPTNGLGWVLFPFGRTDALTTWTFGRIEGFPLVLMLALAGLAILAFIGAFLATFGWFVSTDLWRPLVTMGAILSAVLFRLHLGRGRSRPSRLTQCCCGSYGWLPGARR
jgi:hypothetical protein